MIPEQNSSVTFSGEFSHGVDIKGRVTVPSDWRRLLEGETYYLVTDSSRTFLHAMPPEEFRAKAAQIEADTTIPASDRAIFLHHFFSRATKTETDKQGRFVIPEKARKDLGLDTTAILVGANRTFKLFNKDKWQTTQETEEPIFQRVAKAWGI
jgi:MraZ protein